jgi:sugar phosphate isomerase/epimerase
VGAMNNPARPLDEELRRIASAGFDFVDLTLEPPHAWPCEPARVRGLLEEHGLAVVGHTAYYLPIASPFPELRRQTLELLLRMLDSFAELGAEVANVHPDPSAKLVPLADVVALNAETIATLAEEAAARGLRLAVENLGLSFGRVENLRPIFEAAPAAGFHLDVGHANLARGRDEPNRTAELLAAFGDRLAHVHVSDNLGVDDLHLPLGAGTVDWPAAVRALEDARWDGTVTIEVFANEPAQVELSRRLWLDWWRSV